MLNPFFSFASDTSNRFADGCWVVQKWETANQYWRKEFKYLENLAVININLTGFTNFKVNCIRMHDAIQTYYLNRCGPFIN